MNADERRWKPFSGQRLTARKNQLNLRPSASICGLLLTFLASLTILPGCAPEAKFKPDAVAAIDATPEQQQQIANVLTAWFGTPDAPRLPPGETGLDLEKLKLAAGPVLSNTPGVTHGLYRRHCARCHGVTGDGAGPTALFQAPYPRDFRTGVFKFKSTYRGAPPTNADLRHTLTNGLAGSSMPSFALLTDEELDALVEYTKYLSMRGQFERRLARYVAEELELDAMLSLDNADTATELREDLLTPLLAAWWDAPQQVIPVPAPPELTRRETIAAGEALFHGPRANCAKCHGQLDPNAPPPSELSPDDYDEWNLARRDFQNETARAAERLSSQLTRVTDQLDADHPLAIETAVVRRREEIASELLPVRKNHPRALAVTALRAGAKPQDLFRRLHQGIAGAAMPSYGVPAPGGTGVLSDEEIWQLVAYVRDVVGENANSADSTADSTE
jgi:mono/diheme cytochrome c family protein